MIMQKFQISGNKYKGILFLCSAGNFAGAGLFWENEKNLDIEN